MKNLLYFSTAQTDKNSWIKLEKQIGENIDEFFIYVLSVLENNNTVKG